MECEHYERNCLLQCPTCALFFPCRICHDEATKHQLDRYNVKTIKCKTCEKVQPKSNKCQNCQCLFGKYYCECCSMFDDREKGQFHCEQCHLCRVGGKENFFHCNKCDMCYSVAIKDTHVCIEKSSRCNCAVCMEDLHTSREYIHVPKCGHLLHTSCYNSLLKSGNYRCPTCGKSTLDMKEAWSKMDEEIAQTPMPPEYKNIKQWILCQDCQKTCRAKFHIVGMKCVHCGSYNTCNTKAPDGAVESDPEENEAEFYVEDMD